MVRYLVIVIGFLFLLQILLTNFLSVHLAKQKLKQDLQDKIDLIKEDITYKDGTWNIDRYNTDPQLLSTYPLYIITINGTVLDRKNPIKGFLDTAEFNPLLLYEIPQTVSSITGNNRRVLSNPITDNNKNIVAVVAVSYFNPDEYNLPAIDEKLIKSLNAISEKIKIDKKTINVKNIDERDIPYDISFMIVDKYNATLLKSTNVNSTKRVPTKIDPSYIKKFLSSPMQQTIIEEETNHRFLVISEPIVKNGQTLALIAVGTSLDEVMVVVNNFILLFGFIDFVLFITIILLIKKSLQTSSSKINANHLSNIHFDTKQSILFINQQEIPVAYATNQYYLLKTLFSNPRRRFETDELLEKFGEMKAKNDGRKIYDTMTNINKKTAGYLHAKLIINQHKTYQLNPQLPIKKTKK